MLKRYVIRVEYLGKNYSGSQIQLGRTSSPPTIQSELEKALCTLIGEGKKLNPLSPQNIKRVKTVFSGRTDRGVNSKGQIVHFDTEKTLVASKFIHSMNGLLPNDISVSDLKEVGTNFHAQKSAKKRYYQYVFWNKKQRSAFDGDLPLIKWNLDISRMQDALIYLQGEHNFSSFRSSGSTTKNEICFIYSAECKKLGDMVVVDIVGNRFLYNMVRTIVGTLLLIEKNDLPAETMKVILEGKDRAKAGKTVSPYGLTLMKVDY